MKRKVNSPTTLKSVSLQQYQIYRKEIRTQRITKIQLSDKGRYILPYWYWPGRCPAALFRCRALFNIRWAIVDNAGLFSSEKWLISDKITVFNRLIKVFLCYLRLIIIFRMKNMSKYTHLSGVSLINNALLNKGTAFSVSERGEFNLNGLLPNKLKRWKNRFNG